MRQPRVRGKDYGIRRKPPAGDWLSVKPGARIIQPPGQQLAREGAGDYRYDGQRYQYASKRNGLPELACYGVAGQVAAGGREWRKPGSGWAARIAARNMDLAAIAAADRPAS